MRFTSLFLALLICCFLGACADDQEQAYDDTGGAEKYYQKFNEDIHAMVESKLAGLAEAQTKLDAEDLTPEQREKKQDNLDLDIKKFNRRKAIGDFIQFKTPEDIPADLVWDNGMDQPEIGSEEAIKGGVFTYFISQFPKTLRPTGQDSNHSFRSYMYDDVQPGLVRLHPNTGAVIPGIASEWASTEDRQEIFYRIHPDATYSDGAPIKAGDYLRTIYVYTSDNIINPFYKQYFKDNWGSITQYDDRTFSIKLPEPSPNPAILGKSFYPSSPVFYKEYGPDYMKRYQWRVPPSTGAYQVYPEGVVKGRSITLTRVKDWWGKDLKYNKNRYNPDKLVYKVIADPEKAFEIFRAGQLDFVLLGTESWYEKTEFDSVYKGYIHKAKFYTQYPRVPRGIYFNCSKPRFDDVNFRIGMQHSINMEKLIALNLRGDATRLNIFAEGFGRFSNPNIRSRKFSISKAHEAFAKAGYTPGAGGLLRDKSGNPLEVSLSIPSIPTYREFASRFSEEAKKVGLTIKQDAVEPSLFFQKLISKQPDMALSGWGATPPYPAYHQFFHSENAYDDKGQPKSATNNVNCYANPEADFWIDKYRFATTEDELQEAAYKIEEILHRDAPYLPGWTQDFYRVGYWRWVKWPDDFNVKIGYLPDESYVLWIDEEARKETLAAKASGKAFEETTLIFEQYRKKANP